ncbi:MAG: phosphomannomutase/phosphoglucomutase [bacterium]
MDINQNIFKAYDIRGVYHQDFDEAMAYQLGLAYVKFREQELGKTGLRIVASCDMRLSSPILKQSLIKGLSDGGAEVIDIGLSATPTFYFAVAHYGYDGGIQVSASHNPKDWNGFKLVRQKALPIGLDNGLAVIRDLIMAGNLQPAVKVGAVTVQENIVVDQVQHDLQYVDVKKIKPFKIVVDPANAMGADYFEELFKFLPGQLIKMNWELDGNFPVHEADPYKLENIKGLCQKVLSEQADLGIATDGDGDRIFFVDELGEPISAGITRAILCQLFLQDKPGAKIAYDIRPGKITEDIVKANNGVPVITKVGHSLIKLQAVEEGAYFAGEASGHFFLNMEEGCYEVPIIVTLKLLQALSTANERLSRFTAPFQKYYHSGEISLSVPNVQAKLAQLKTKYHDGQINELDGLSVTYPDFWFNVRASNTESLLRLNLEAVSQEVMQTKREEVLALIKA